VAALYPLVVRWLKVSLVACGVTLVIVTVLFIAAFLWLLEIGHFSG
jgi:hypothetical protein